MVNTSPARFAKPSTSGSTMPADHDDRSEAREALAVEADIRTYNGMKWPVHVLDLSCHGCQISGCSELLRVGSFLSIKFATLTYLLAIVRWVDGDKAGIEFSQALHPAVFEHSLRHLPKVENSESAPGCSTSQQNNFLG
jgi:hypothetical protein